MLSLTPHPPAKDLIPEQEATVYCKITIGSRVRRNPATRVLFDCDANSLFPAGAATGGGASNHGLTME